MASAEQIIDEHFGMVGKESAEKIAKERSDAQMPRQQDSKSQGSITVGQIIDGKVRVEMLADLEEVVYRVYNRKEIRINGEEVVIRVIVLGSQGENARAILFKEKADIANSLPIERGDRLLLKDFLVKRGYNGLELASMDRSTVSRISSGNTGINDFGKIQGREIDLVGRIVSIGPVKHSIFSIGRDNDSCSFEITDGARKLRVSVVGNAVQDIAQAHPGDCVKVEFGQVRENDIYVNEGSRILVGETLNGRTMGRSGP
ncbi:MAG: hypothetical protein KGH59_02600 [Candidatus Micrarchaeota archaeon]|nr:hypothetical protein [Candidatus Micrarchaeota archaeon]